jgi:PDZ-binding kinase
VNVFTLERSPKVGFIRSPWAIKKRNRNVTDDSRYNLRIKFEADILKKLKHPNIVEFRAFTYGVNGDPCLAMEKLDISLGLSKITVKYKILVLIEITANLFLLRLK